MHETKVASWVLYGILILMGLTVMNSLFIRDINTATNMEIIFSMEMTILIFYMVLSYLTTTYIEKSSLRLKVFGDFSISRLGKLEARIEVLEKQLKEVKT